MVRIRAGLTLAAGLPDKPFSNSQNLMPVLSEALRLFAGGRNALVVDADENAANALAAILRPMGFDVITDASLYDGLRKVREQLSSLDAIFVASNVASPSLADGIAQVRSEFRFGATPIIVIAKGGDRQAAEQIVRGKVSMGMVDGSPTSAAISESLDRISRAVGIVPITPELGMSLAYEAAEVLSGLAFTNNRVFDVTAAESALLATLSANDLNLRLLVAEVLGYIGTARAQEAIAEIALNPQEPPGTRMPMFTALAEATKRKGNLLSGDTISKLTEMAQNEPDLALREAASRALGALNLPSTPASEIIREQYRG
jgi:CheY-like chemotaxis protein